MADPCIRCSQCAQVCPVDLQPQFLHAAIKGEAWDQVAALNLDACLFCQACTAACPSQINLKDQFIEAAHQHSLIQAQRESALIAKQRFEAREFRLARKKQLQEARRVEKLKEVALDQKQAAIQAALARAQWKYEDA